MYVLTFQYFFFLPQIEAMIYLKAEHNDVQGEHGLPVSGYFYYGKHAALMDPPKADRLGLKIEFDPGKDF